MAARMQYLVVDHMTLKPESMCSPESIPSTHMTNCSVENDAERNAPAESITRKVEPSRMQIVQKKTKIHQSYWVMIWTKRNLLLNFPTTQFHPLFGRGTRRMPRKEGVNLAVMLPCVPPRRISLVWNESLCSWQLEWAWEYAYSFMTILVMDE